MPATMSSRTYSNPVVCYLGRVHRVLEKWLAGADLLIDILTAGHLQRPVATLMFAVALVVSLCVVAPLGWAWFPVVFFTKILPAHAVTEAPCRPTAGT